jgi:exodeoxyribonuclease V alpha subunit
VRYPSGEAGGYDGREVTNGWGELDNLMPAYACTIHKSQGSEYAAVVIPLLPQHYVMLQRNLVYIGITSCLPRLLHGSWASPDSWQ